MDIKSIRENVYDIYRYSKYGDDRAMNSMIKFYEQGVRLPQQSMLIMRDEFKKQMQNDAEKIEDMLFYGAISQDKATDEFAAIDFVPFEVSILEDKPEVQPALDKFIEAFEKLYPKTYKIRQELINQDRVLWDSVTPKTNWFKKLKIMKHVKLY